MNLLGLFAGVLTVTFSFVIAFSFTNCGQEMESNSAKNEASLVYLGADGRPMETKLSYEVKGDDVIVQGDMIVGKKSELVNGNKFIVNFARSKYEDFEYKLGIDKANGKQTVALRAVKDQYDTNWPGGIVPIKFEGKIPNLKRIVSHIDSFNKLMVEKRIKVKIVLRTNENIYASIKSEYDSCSATVGYNWFSTINLGESCSTERIVHHELLHVLGFKHEQSRSDRDDHVIIKAENIIDGKEGNFVKLENSFNYTGYDFNSVMHYDGWAFSKNSKPTIIRRHSDEGIFAKSSMSKGDFAGLLELYERGSYSDVATLVDNQEVINIINGTSEPTEVIKPVSGIIPVNPGHVVLGALPPGLIEGRQYIADGFMSKVYRHTKGVTCYVPDGHFKNVIEKPKKWINQLLAYSKLPPQVCKMGTVISIIGQGNSVVPPKGLAFNQQYIAKGFTSKVLKITNDGVCQVQDGHFYDVKEISKTQINSILKMGGENEMLKKCSIN